MIDEDKLDNVIANNLDGYGIILQNTQDKTLEVTRAYTQGGTKFDDVREILAFNKDRRRIVHVRNQTAGILNQENVHPFKVFESEQRDVWMMHNGTIGAYRPKVGDDRSDTRIFGEEFVMPLLKGFAGEFGNGDYNSPVVQSILAKFGDTGFVNRLIFVSNDLEPLLLGNWTKIKNDDGSEFVASNDSYFKSIVRGPRKPVVPFQNGRQWTPTGGTTHSGQTHGSNSQVSPSLGTSGVKETKTEENQKAQEPTTTKKVIPLAEAQLGSVKKEFIMPERLLESVSEWYEDFGLYAVTFLKYNEIKKLVEDLNADENANLILNLAETLNQMEADLDVAEQQLKEYQTGELSDERGESYEELKKEIEILESKHEKSTKLNATLKAQNNELQKCVNALQTQMAIMEAYTTGQHKAA